MEHNILSLDFWQDTVTYEGQTIPTGTLGCAALNIPEEDIKIVATPVAGAKVGRAEVFAALTAWLTQQSAKVKF